MLIHPIESLLILEDVMEDREQEVPSLGRYDGILQPLPDDIPPPTRVFVHNIGGRKGGGELKVQGLGLYLPQPLRLHETQGESLFQGGFNPLKLLG